MLLVYGPRSPSYDFGPGHPVDAAPVRTGDRPAPCSRCDARSGSRAGRGRGAPGLPLRGVRERRPRLLLGSLRAASGRDRRGRRCAPVPGHARGRFDGGRRIAASDGGDPARRRRARLPPGRRSAPCNARPRIRLLHLQRRGAGRGPGPPRRTARPVYRSRRAPRRRRPGAVPGRPGRPDGVLPRDRALPLSGDGLRRRDRGGGCGRDLGQRAARAGDGRGAVARCGPVAGAVAGGSLPAGHRGVAARRRLARVRSAGAPPGHDDRDGSRGTDRRCGRAPLGGWPLAGDGWRRLRRVSGRTPIVVARVAGGSAPGGASGDPRRVAGAVGR